MNDADVRVQIYQNFIRTGRAPSATALAEAMGVAVDEIRTSLERLASTRTLALQPESREILFAAPLSAVPTPYVVHARSQSFFAPCAWDALGVIGMLKADGSIETSCPCCGEGMSVEVRDGAPVTHTGLVHFALPARRWWDNIVFT